MFGLFKKKDKDQVSIPFGHAIPDSYDPNASMKHILDEIWDTKETGYVGDFVFNSQTYKIEYSHSLGGFYFSLPSGFFHIVMQDILHPYNPNRLEELEEALSITSMPSRVSAVNTSGVSAITSLKATVSSVSSDYTGLSSVVSALKPSDSDFHDAISLMDMVRQKDEEIESLKEKIREYELLITGEETRIRYEKDARF